MTWAPSDSVLDAVAVTPSDTVPLAFPTRAIYVGGTGDVSAILSSGNTATFSAVQAGTLLPIVATQIKQTATTATLILALR